MMQDSNRGAKWDRIKHQGPDNFEICRVDRVEAMKHLNPEGALSGFDLDDHEGLAIRAALDMIGQLRDPPVAGNAAIRAALKDYLAGIGYWPAQPPHSSPTIEGE